MKRFFLVLTVVMISLCMAAAASAQVIVSQTPNQINGVFSDVACSFCAGSQSLADNFTLVGPETIYQIRLWGGYFSTDTPFADNFTVIFHNDSAGAVGSLVSTESNVPVISRTATGSSVAAVTEYEYVLALATPVSIGPGTYWVEIFNDSTGAVDDFFWESGSQDVVFGIPGEAFSFTAPGAAWNYNSIDDLAFELINVPAAAAVVPTTNEWGLIIFMVLAGLGAAYYLPGRKNEA